MTSNASSTGRKKLGDIDDLQRGRPLDGPLGGPAFASNTNSPFSALSSRHGRPLRIAILSDFVRIPYANGAAFQTRFLYQQLRRCGHEVTIIGPHDPDASPEDLAPGTISLPSIPLRTYPGVHFPLPLAKWVYDASRWNFDLVFAQTTSMLMEFGVWLRKMRGIPLLCVNTTHLVAAYDVLLPQRISEIEAVHAGVELILKKPFERTFAGIYNESDGLVVLSEGLRRYWRERGVTVPVHVIPRAVQPELFDKPLGNDPYLALGVKEGTRLLCAGRHTREKSQDRVIRIFAEHVASRDPNVTLIMLGDGPDTRYYKAVAKDVGVEHRVIFPGEVPFEKMVDYYSHADIFVHASVSETYGNVMGEALWCGTPTVAFADGMGVSSQIEDGVNGMLLSPGNRSSERSEGTYSDAERAFGQTVFDLMNDPERRAELGKNAARIARERAHPLAVEARLADAFRSAQEHSVSSGLRPAASRPKAMQWITTARHFWPWTSVSMGVYLAGHLRPNVVEPRDKSSIHPQIGE